MGLGAFYRRSFETRPWLTLSVTNGLFSLVADVLAQTIESRTSETEAKSWDTSRSLRFLTYGTALGPLLAEWNQFLETRFTVRSATGRMLWRGLASRVAMDQLLMAPLTTGLFVGAMGIMEGRRTMDALREKYEGLYMPAILANWKVWPFLQLINFSVMPLRLRVPFTATCGIAWTLYLSMLNQGPRKVPA